MWFLRTSASRLTLGMDLQDGPHCGNLHYLALSSCSSEVSARTCSVLCGVHICSPSHTQPITHAAHHTLTSSLTSEVVTLEAYLEIDGLKVLLHFCIISSLKHREALEPHQTLRTRGGQQSQQAGHSFPPRHPVQTAVSSTDFGLSLLTHDLLRAFWKIRSHPC